MRRKNALEFILLGLFIMCMVLALSAALEYNTRATERQYLRQGAYLLFLTGYILACFFGIRVVHKASPKMPDLFKNILCFLACAALIFAGIYLRLRTIQEIVLEPDSDFETYYRLANHLLNGTILRPEAQADREYIAQYPHTIGFPMLVLLPVFRILGPTVHHALMANLVSSMLSVLLTGRIAYRTMGRGACVIAIAFTSLWPSHILYGTMVATEPSFTLGVVTALNLMVSLMDRRKNSLYDVSPSRALVSLVLLGVVLGLSAAIRPMAVLLFAAWAATQLLRRGDPTGEIPTKGIRVMLSKGWICVLVVGLFYLGTGNIITRAIRDTIMEQPATGLTASGYNMMVGLNVEHRGIWNQEDAEFFAESYEQTGSAEKAHAAAMQRALERIGSEPENVMDLMVYKFRDLWQTDDFGVDWNLLWMGQQNLLTEENSRMLESVRTYSRPLYMLILALSLLGAIEAWRRQRAPMALQMVCILFFLGTALSHMILETQVRYHYNMIPVLILLSVICIHQWREHKAEEPTVKLVIRQNEESVKEHEDHTRFDMAAALAAGHVKMTVSAAYDETEQQPVDSVKAEETPLNAKLQEKESPSR